MARVGLLNAVNRFDVDAASDFLAFAVPTMMGEVRRYFRDHGWSWRRVIPHGGHQMSLNMAAGLGLGGNESYPGVFQPFGGFADNIPIKAGHVRLPDAPGIGFELKPRLYGLIREIAQ